MEENKIKDIVFSPQSYSLHSIKAIASDATAQKQLTSVFGSKMLKSMLSSDCESDIPNGGLYKTDNNSNLVVFWGMPHSGRTSAIFSLLSQKGFRIIWPTQFNLVFRIKRILSLFKNQNVTFMPDLSVDDVSEIYQAKYKSWLFGRSYNISFFKPQTDYKSYEVLRVLNSHSEQIHVFCIDCGKDDKVVSYLEQQVDYHEQIIRFLEEQNILQQSNAIYLLVTKSDLMNVPDIYEENAAQTFVTSGMPDFWHKIREVCYNKEIYDVQPVVFSIGNFVLKDFAKIDADYAKIFLEESILPKSQPNQNWLEKLLSKGKVKYTPIFVTLVLLLVGFGIFYVWNAIIPPPEQKVAPFNYTEFFMDQEKGLKTQLFEKAANTYQTLRNDLNVERSLRLADGSKVLPDSINHRCDSVLTNDFSSLLTKELETLFASKKWTSNELLLKRRDRQVTELISHSSLKATAIKDYHDYIQNYLYVIKPILAKSTKCKSVDEVRTIVSKAARWTKHPYNKDTQLNKKLSDVKSNAYKSCAENYRRIANTRIKEYNAEVSKMNKTLDWYISSNRRNSLKQKFQMRNETLVNSINQLISDLKSVNDSRLISTRKSLEQTKSALVSIYK